MSWGEAVRLTVQLARDPSSHIAAALGDLSAPTSREALVLMDLFDLQHASKAKHRPKPYPRPWDKPPRTFGRGTSMSPEELSAVLAAHREGAARG